MKKLIKTTVILLLAFLMLGLGNPGEESLMRHGVDKHIKKESRNESVFTAILKTGLTKQRKLQQSTTYFGNDMSHAMDLDDAGSCSPFNASWRVLFALFGLFALFALFGLFGLFGLFSLDIDIDIECGWS